MKDLQCTIKLREFEGFIYSNKNRWRVNKNKFDNIQVSKPSDKLLQAFSQLIKPLFEQIKNLSLKNLTLKQTRDLLLPRLISGEIDVEDMEIV